MDTFSLAQRMMKIIMQLKASNTMAAKSDALLAVMPSFAAMLRESTSGPIK